MKSSYVTVILIGLYSVTGSEGLSSWRERDPRYWHGSCTTGQRQSPINIDTNEAVKTDLGPLKFIRYDFAFSGNLTNNGYTVKIRLDGAPIHLEGADLPTTYILEQIHFHWPAEHTVDENLDTLEIHFVHYSDQYQNTSEASQYKDGVAVVATLCELSDEDNLDIMPILKATESVSKVLGGSTELTGSKVIPGLFLPRDRASYYRYDGSLTTPECQETVMWFILTQKLWISTPQLNIFRNIKTDNHRPIQPLGGRRVYLHLNGYSSATTFASNLSLTCFSYLLGKLLHSKL